MSESAEESLPDPPEEPLSSDCCGGGCVPCVMDIYQEQLEQWEKLKSMTPSERSKWREEQRAREKGSQVRKVAVSLAEYRAFTITNVEQISKDSFIFTFGLPLDTTLGLQVGQHIVLRVRETTGGYVSRQYTPITPLEQTGSFQVLIKVYEDGQMSQHVSQWRVGSSAEWRGPFGGFTYSPNKYRHIGLLCCGTGIAPMIQVIRAVVENEDEETFLHLVYGCRTQNDILLKKELDHFNSYWNFTVLYSLSRTSQSSLTSNPGSIKYADKVHLGRINRKLVEQEMPRPQAGGRSIVLICGTQSFDEDMIRYLTQIGYTSNMYFKY